MRGRAFLIGLLVWVSLVSLASFVSADTPPNVRINTPENGSTVNGVVVVSGNAWDDVGVRGVKVRMDQGDWMLPRDTSGNGTWWSWALEWDTTKVPNGGHGVGAIAWDAAQQTGDAHIEVSVHNEPTNHPPKVAIDDPANHATVRGTVAVKGRAEDPDPHDGVELVQVRIGRREWRDATPGPEGTWATWTFSWDTTTVPDGWHPFSARAFDGEMYSEPVIFEYFVDNNEAGNTAPTATIVHPREESVHELVLVHGTANDPDPDDAVELVQVRIDRGEWHSAVDTSHDRSWSTWAFPWDTTKSENGAHTVCAQAFDGELFGEPSCITVKVANEDAPPKVLIAHPKDGQRVEDLVLIHGRAADDHGVRLVEIRFNEGEWLKATDTSTDDAWATWAFEWNTKRMDDGCVHIGARAWDGNQFSRIHTIVACVDNANDRPMVKIVHPEDGETVHGVVLVHGVASDDGGVKLVQVHIDESEWHRAMNTGHGKSWSTWAFEWDTTQTTNGEHRVCARSFDGEQYSELSCVTVVVSNESGGGGGGRAPPLPLGNATPFLTLSLFAGLGVATLMWLRAHGYLRK